MRTKMTIGIATMAVSRKGGCGAKFTGDGTEEEARKGVF
jgi:hypothetical protein